jgi:hypothetical protein
VTVDFLKEVLKRTLTIVLDEFQGCGYLYSFDLASLVCVSFSKPFFGTFALEFMCERRKWVTIDVINVKVTLLWRQCM